MKCPTIKTLVSRLGIDEETAKTLRGLMKGTIDPETVPAVQDWIRQCYHRPPDKDLIMCALDSVLGTFGVEGLGTMRCWDCQSRGLGDYSPYAEYLNMGDSYLDTIILDNFHGRFYIGCWGNLVNLPWIRHED